MRVKFIRSIERFKPGDIIECPDGHANVWIKRGIVIRLEVEEEKQSKKRRKEYMVPPEARHA